MIYNSKHANEVASWIVSGFLTRTTLSIRLKLLDDQFYNIILKNAKDIERLDKTKNLGEENEKNIYDYYQKIADTRIYIHYNYILLNE